MDNSDKEKLQKEITQLSDRVKLNGRDSEIVKISLDLTLSGQNAINYKVMKMFAPELSDKQLVQLIYLLGQKNAIELIKVLSMEQGIKI